MIDENVVVATLGPLNGTYFHIPDLTAYARKVTSLGRCAQVSGPQPGFPACYVLFYENDAEIFISMVWTEPGQRQRGLAEGLLRRIVRQSHKDVRLQVHRDNPAKGLYERLGFVTVGMAGETETMIRPSRVAIMQPYLFPYVGYFHLIESSDLFVFYDDVNYIKRGWINRNYILVQGCRHRFSVPVAHGSQNLLIKDTIHAYDNRWVSKFRATLESAYRKAPFREDVIDLVMSTFASAGPSIADLAISSILAVCDYINRPFEYERSSICSPESRGMDKADRLIRITKELGYRAYVNAAGGEKLYDEPYFEERGVRLDFLQSDPVTYSQGGGEDFAPGLSILDVLMYNAPDAVAEHFTKFRMG